MKRETQLLIFWIALAIAVALLVIKDKSERATISEVESFPNHSEIQALNK